MTIKDLNVFVAVAQYENITKAASSLYMSQPQVSFLIKEMEEEIGFPLFTRVKKRIRLSPKGKEFLSYANKVLSSFEEMEEFARGEQKKKRVVVSSSLSMGEVFLSPLFKPLEEQGEYDFTYRIETGDQVIGDMETGRSDIGFIEGGSYGQDLDAKSLFRDRLVLVSCLNFPVPERICLEKLGDYPLLLRNAGSGTRAIFDSALAGKSVRLSVKAESMSNYALLEMAKNGFGIAVVPYAFARSSVENGQLKTSQIEGISLERTFTLITRKTNPYSELAERIFQSFSKEYNLDSSKREKKT